MCVCVCVCVCVCGPWLVARRRCRSSAVFLFLFLFCSKGNSRVIIEFVCAEVDRHWNWYSVELEITESLKGDTHSLGKCVYTKRRLMYSNTRIPLLIFMIFHFSFLLLLLLLLLPSLAKQKGPRRTHLAAIRRLEFRDRSLFIIDCDIAVLH